MSDWLKRVEITRTMAATLCIALFGQAVVFGAALYVVWALFTPIPECRSNISTWKAWCLFGYRNWLIGYDEPEERHEKEND